MYASEDLLQVDLFSLSTHALTSYAIYKAVCKHFKGDSNIECECEMQAPL